MNLSIVAGLLIPFLGTTAGAYDGSKDGAGYAPGIV